MGYPPGIRGYQPFNGLRQVVHRHKQVVHPAATFADALGGFRQRRQMVKGVPDIAVPFLLSQTAHEIPQVGIVVRWLAMPQGDTARRRHQAPPQQLLRLVPLAALHGNLGRFQQPQRLAAITGQTVRQRRTRR